MASKMTALVVAYPSTTDHGEATKFDMDYYLSGHMPLIDKAWTPFGMKSWSINSFTNPDPLTNKPPPYLVQTTIYWDNQEDAMKALGGPMKEETGKDVEKFSNVFPKIWMSEVVRKDAVGDGLEGKKGVVG